MPDAGGAIRVVVPGALNTDIIAVGVPYLPGEGEDVYARELIITAGGKARNVAEMIARLAGPGAVAMLSRTSRDPFGLWKPPVDALEAAGVRTDHVFVADDAENSPLPGIALIAVDPAGRRHGSIYNAVLTDFSAADIDRGHDLFDAAARNSGFLVLTLEIPMKTAAYAMSLAASLGIRVILDPGGLRHDAVPDDLFGHLHGQPVYLIKPNEHEAKLLSGIGVTDHESASRAAAIIRGLGAENVLITHGAHGGYLISDGISEHIPVPAHGPVAQADATGCGDQVTAAMCAALCEGASLPSAARYAIAAGTLQFSRVGVQPVSQADMASWTLR